jgi:hypothetical protein
MTSPALRDALERCANAIDALFSPAHHEDCLWLNDHTRPCQCGARDRELSAVCEAQKASASAYEALRANSSDVSVPVVTDEMVERALVAFWCDPHWDSEDNMSKEAADLTRKDMRRALQSALLTTTTPTVTESE